MAVDRETWSQQPDESNPAFAAFMAYRDMGVTRTIAKVKEATGKSDVRALERWSSKYQWVMRAQAWDRNLEHEWQRELVQMRIETSRRNLLLARTMQNKIVERLRTIQTEGMNSRDLAYWFQITTQVMHQALGEPTRVELTGKDGGPIDVSVLSDEERRARLDQLKREIESRTKDDEPTGSL